VKLLVIDIYTRELLELRVHDGWDVDSRWTSRAFNTILAHTKRKPIAVVHDHGTHFLGQFARQLRVLGIDDQLTPCGRRPRVVFERPAPAASTLSPI
jgi:hypothetical protein